MHVYLINPRYQGNDAGYTFPVGLAYVGAVLLEAGHTVEALDIPGHRLTDAQVEEMLASLKAPGLVGIGSLISNVPSVQKVISQVRAAWPETPVVLGGGMATSMPEFIARELQPDILVLGEGERTVVRLVEALEKRVALSSVPGLAYLEGGRYVTTEKPGEIMDLDSLPFPAWDLFPVENYVYRTLTDWGRVRAMPMATSRSCPCKCVHCAHTSGWVPRFRSAESVVNEIEELVKRYRVEAINFYDELFTANRQRVLDICALIQERGLKVQWYCTSRVNLADLEMYQAMRAAGCRLITYGFESGSNTILKNLRKGATVEQNERAIRITREAGLEAQGTFMLGNPGETDESIDATAQFIIDNNLTVFDFNFTTPYPDAPVFLDLLDKGRIPDLKKFVFSLAEATTLTFNLSKMPDDRLIAGRARALDKLYSHYAKNLHPKEVTNDQGGHWECFTCGTVLTPESERDTLLTWHRCSECKRLYFWPLRCFPKAQANLDRLQARLDTLKAEGRNRILFYAGGTHTIRLLVDLDIDGLEVVGVADSNPAKKGTQLLGYPVVHRDDLPAMLEGIDAIVISSYQFSEAIYQDLLPLARDCELIRIYQS